MPNIIHFNMLVEINQLLKENGYDCSLHSIGGCTCSGVELRNDTTSIPLKETVELINEYLEDKWMYVESSAENPLVLKVISRFE